MLGGQSEGERPEDLKAAACARSHPQCVSTLSECVKVELKCKFMV